MTVVSPPSTGPDQAAGLCDRPAQRIVAGALRCVARWGMTKTTLDDVAREAGCGRATLYRLFPGGRDALWATVVTTESGRLLDQVADRVCQQHSLEDVIVAIVTESARALSAHDALRFLMAHEPEAILPHLAFHRMDTLLRSVARAGAPLLAPWLEPLQSRVDSEAAARAVEWTARVVLSYLISPDPDVDLRDEVSARRIVRSFIIPGLQPVESMPA